MDQTDLLRQLVGVLDRMDVPYMVVGSLASAAYGEAGGIVSTVLR